MHEQLSIDSDFPGGNIVLERIRGDQIDLHQDLRDTESDWFYWCFRIRGAAGRSLRFNFTASRALGARGPAISRDGGRTWSWLGRGSTDGNSFRHAFGPDENDVRFSFAMPYQLADWQRFTLARPWLAVDVLGRTRGGRDVPMATLGTGAQHILIAARHHCCEMMPSYSIEGLIDFVHDDPEMGWLREQATITVIPIVDLDGVEAGDQGKMRRPRDHGRDYMGSSIYPEVAALRALLDELRPAVVLDLHCPWIAGEYNEWIYLVGQEVEELAGEQRAFGAALEAVHRGPLPFSAEHYLPFGVSWNTPQNYKLGMALCRYAATLPGIRLAASIELPYATADGAEVNAGTANRFGADLARGMMAYLRS